MKTLLRLALPFVVLPSMMLAIYAPIPEQEQGKPLTYKLGASTYYDSNIFGGATGEISSMVYGLNGAIAYNGSLSDQTFATASYQVSYDYVVDRPGEKSLVNQNLNGRLAHSFSPDTNIDLTAGYLMADNPQSLLAGVPQNTDQSFNRAQLDARFTTAAGQKTGMVAKYRFIDIAYDTAALAADLDRSENLLGLEGSYALLPETKLVAEYRYQTIAYDTGGDTKDKDSNFLMAGMDYNPSEELLMSARGGFEARDRNGAPDTTSPYVELNSRYTYSEGSFLAVGYTYALEEPSDVTNYTDAEVNRFFLNLQHQISGKMSASGSVTYEPAQLQGRPGVHADIDEKTFRFGLGLTWQPTENWSVSGTYDLDNVNSDDPARGQNRDRCGVSARYTF